MTNAERIAEIDRELAELRRQRAEAVKREAARAA